MEPNENSIPILNLKLEERTVECKIIKLPIKMKLYKIKVLYSKVKMKKFHTDTVYVMVDPNIERTNVNEAIINAVTDALPPDMVLLQIDRERIKDTIEIKMDRVIPNKEQREAFVKTEEDEVKPPLYWSELSNAEKEAIIKHNKEVIENEDNDFVEINHKRFVEGAYVRCGNYIRKITKVVYNAYGVLDLTVFWDDGKVSGHGEANCSYKHYTMI